MKLVERLLFLFIVLCFCARAASADIGQNSKEVEARYGAGKALTAQKPADETKTYSFNGMHILVQYWKGMSSSEQYQKNDGSIISEAEISAILAANVGSSSWHQASNDVWVRVDKAAIAYMGDHRKALIVQLYTFHVEEKKLEQTGVADKPKPAVSDAPPATMMKIVSRYISSSVPADSFAAKPKTMYKAGETYARAEDEEDSQRHMHQLLITREPDIWIINLDGLQGKHLVDPGPNFTARIPLMAPSSPGDLPALAMGSEVAFFQQHHATLLNPRLVDAQMCEVFEYGYENYRLVLNVVQSTQKPFQLDVFKDEKHEYSIRYISYETDIPFDAMMFAPPAGVAMTESKTFP